MLKIECIESPLSRSLDSYLQSTRLCATCSASIQRAKMTLSNLMANPTNDNLRALQSEVRDIDVWLERVRTMRKASAQCLWMQHDSPQ